MESSLVQLHLTLVILKDECQGNFKGLYLVKEPSNRPYVSIKHQ